MIPWEERKCPACGDDRGFLWSVTRNELLLISALLLLILFGITTFSVKAYHARERELAEQWYTAGERELAAGRAAKALGDFRSALIYSRNDSRVELQLAHALVAARHPNEARAYLLGFWESEPGNGMLNLELARLAGQSGLTPEAVQYYHNALYGQWNDDPAGHRRQAALELAEFLLRVGQKPQAQAELVALTAELPSDPVLETRVAALLLETGEYEHAVPLFRQALRVRPDYDAALEGAGEASFAMRNYRNARRFLAHAKRLGGLPALAQSHLDTSTLILGSDPLAPRLSGQERASRALRAFTQSMERLSACAAARGVSFDTSGQPSELQKVHALATALQPKVRQRDLARDPDLVIKVTDTVFGIEKATEHACGEPQGLDLALYLLSSAPEGGSE